MTLRDQRQREFADAWLRVKYGILYLCPRFGKIRTSINILNDLPDDTEILIAYPDKAIKKSWENDFKATEFDYKGRKITWTTHLSLKKQLGQFNNTDGVNRLAIIDEIHLLSAAQIVAFKELRKEYKWVLGLTGTMSRWTEKTFIEMGFPPIAKYPIQKAIEEGVITDYRITIHTTQLDNTKFNNYKGSMRTEAYQFGMYSNIIAKLEEEGGETKMLRLARMRIIQNSYAKLLKTKDVLRVFKGDRVLVFCGLTGIADSLGIPSFHSRTKDREILERFSTLPSQRVEDNHLAVCKLGNTGVTYNALNKVVINYFDSNGENLTQKINRAMALEFNNPNKIADIHIICTNESVERKWLSRALEFFEPSKITWA